MTTPIRMNSPVVRALLLALMVSLILTGMPWGAEKASASIPADKKIIVGYWHNFDNGSGNIRLRDISPDFDVINVSFAEPTNGPQGGTIGFAPYNATDAEFISDIQYLQSQGKKVIISIGGANGQVQLASTAARNAFVSSMKAIITKYGFNGLDIDFEGHSLYLNSGDSDFRNPTTPVITNLISAVRELHDFYGDAFMLTMAPETFFVQVGYTFYGGSCISCDNRAGAYLPVIHALRDILDWLQVQHYNSGSITALDNQYYAMGNADFHVAMADMVLTGFPIARNANYFFPPLRPDQVVIGLPANQNAGGGFTSVAEVQKALNYLMKGQSYGGAYQLRGGSHPGMRGLMTWSINWDKYNNFQFSTNHRAYLDQLGGGGGNDVTPPTAPANLISTGKTQNSVSLSWSPSTDDRGVTGYIIYYGNKQTTVTGTSATINELFSNTAYTFTAKARDAAGNLSAASAPLTVTTDAPILDVAPPTVPGNVQSTGKTSTSVSLSWNASTDNVGVIGYEVKYGSITVNVPSTSATISGLTPGTAYTFTVKAYDAALNISAASAPVTVTTDPASVCTVQEWNASTAYNGAQRASYGGTIYEAKWWTRGDRPDLSGAWGAWKVIGPCGDGPGTGGDTIAPSAPSGLASTGATSSSISLSWNASTDNVGVTGYTVYYGTSSVNVTGTTATISGLSPNTSYTFTVKAKDAAGNLSSASNALQASTSEGTTGPTTWVAQKSYVAGDIVTYAGKTYLCLQPHTSLTGWEPSNVPALWRLQ
ncbi:fibronectin type III domain-containing protein [Paenibacillus sp. NPDC057967]|uniref:fibronectin type III domain-containing protein n=1 Tax=Paenibacillus sp. NPDC057967 TaxID=3346293 RepID=UPI0036D979D2